MEVQRQDAAASESLAGVPWDRFTAAATVPQGPTDELVVWLNKLDQKMRAVRSARRLDLCKEVLLERARTVAQSALRARQFERRQRWQTLYSSWEFVAENSPVEEEDEEEEEEIPNEEPNSSSNSLCDCSCCILCQRHQSQMFGKCYCHVIFNPSPAFMELSLSPVSDLFVDVEESREMDNFLASLGSGGGSSAKRNVEVEEEEDRRDGPKRFKA